MLEKFGISRVALLAKIFQLPNTRRGSLGRGVIDSACRRSDRRGLALTIVHAIR